MKPFIQGTPITLTPEYLAVAKEIRKEEWAKFIATKQNRVIVKSTYFADRRKIKLKIKEEKQARKNARKRDKK